VAHSLLSLAQMPPHSETAGLSVSSARPSTYPYSSTCSTTSTVMTTVTTITTMITVPSATAVSALPTGERGSGFDSSLDFFLRHLFILLKEF
jgi:hypothetical protein